MIQISRIYEIPKSDKHYKIFTDRFWPRGVRKEDAVWDEWMKDIAPSTELRKWFNHDPARWKEFRKLYHRELAEKSEEINKIKHLEKEHKDTEHNHAQALKEFLDIK